MSTDPRSPNISLDIPSTPQSSDWIGSISYDVTTGKISLAHQDGNPERTLVVDAVLADGVSPTSFDSAVANGQLSYVIVEQDGEVSLVCKNTAGAVQATSVLPGNGNGNGNGSGVDLNAYDAASQAIFAKIGETTGVTNDVEALCNATNVAEAVRAKMNEMRSQLGAISAMVSDLRDIVRY